MVTVMESVPYTFGIRQLAEFLHKKVNNTPLFRLHGEPQTPSSEHGPDTPTLPAKGEREGKGVTLWAASTR